MSNLVKISEADSALEICISYCESYEKQELESRQLPQLNVSYLNNVLKTIYKSYGISITQVSVMNNDDIKSIGTKWAKKLGFGKKREAFYLNCKILKKE